MTNPDQPRPSLAEASVQDILLELIRRRRFNEFDGRRVVASLQANRSLWTAALMRTDGLPPDPGHDLGPLSLLNLRDIPWNRWNGDTLYLLCEDLVKAGAIKQLAVDHRWKADTAEVYGPSEQVSSALGDSHPAAVVSFWWD